MSVRRLRDVTDVANKYKGKVKPLFSGVVWQLGSVGSKLNRNRGFFLIKKKPSGDQEI